MIGVLPGAGACLPEVSEFWQMLRRLSLGALSGTFVQGGRLKGKNPVYVSGLLSFTLACSCWDCLSVLWKVQCLRHTAVSHLAPACSWGGSPIQHSGHSRVIGFLVNSPDPVSSGSPGRSLLGAAGALAANDG